MSCSVNFNRTICKHTQPAKIVKRSVVRLTIHILHTSVNKHNVRDKTNMLHIPDINKTIFVDLLVDLIKKYQNQMCYKLMFI